MTTQPTTWPDGVIARYVNVAGATVDITDDGEDAYWRYESTCTGCQETRLTEPKEREEDARRWAQAHAEKCRALPRPTT